MRVMLVEDEALILMQIEDLIGDAGHLVVKSAMRGSEAIDLAHDVRPDLAFVHLSLCDGDSGLDVAKGDRNANGGAILAGVTVGAGLSDRFSGRPARSARNGPATQACFRPRSSRHP